MVTESKALCFSKITDKCLKCIENFRGKASPVRWVSDVACMAEERQLVAVKNS